MVAIRHTPDAWRPYAIFFPRLRSWLVRRFIERAGHDLRVKSNADISPNIKVGSRSELGRNAIIYGGVTIGDDVLMGPNVQIITRGHNTSDILRPINLQGSSFKPVTIEDDVWIGCNVVILPGVTVGRGSVLAAGSVVTKDVPSMSIMGGVPARMIGKRGGALE
ncbi:DapH/DapD/GlmU-related protein [Rhodanobacter sp. FDAARGOS 1247]|uniref:DapH/DapD/GlmU-related protein n=1 Tax=Rhodanobacter sp. FDAARGOS 1247 TaxID=2778082 RepID=UPI0034E0D3F9